LASDRHDLELILTDDDMAILLGDLTEGVQQQTADRLG
jgi:hypothetical protein